MVKRLNHIKIVTKWKKKRTVYIIVTFATTNTYTTTSSLNRHVKTKHNGNKSFQNSEMTQNSCEIANEGEGQVKTIHDGKEQFQNSEKGSELQ